MIETGQLHDPNYVLDHKGKARYLFDKKTEDGAVEKIFRKHSKHGSILATAVGAPGAEASLEKNNNNHTVKKRKKLNYQQENHSDDDDDPTFDIRKSSCPKKKSHVVKEPKSKKPYPHILPADSSIRITRQKLQQQEQHMTNAKD